MQTQSVQVQKTFPFSAERVFDAWTDADQLKSWWKPANYNLTDSNTDVKTGGPIDYRFKNEAGEEASLKGSYKEVKEDALLDYDWTWDVSGKPTSDGSSQHITITFTGEGEGCTVKVDQSQDAAMEAESVKHSWEEAMENLQTFLSGKHTGS